MKMSMISSLIGRLRIIIATTEELERITGKEMSGTRQTLLETIEALIELSAKNRGTQQDPLPQRYSGRWIPITERTPEEEGQYLTTTMYGDVFCDYWETCCFDRTETVIAWMPLPAPYKEEE